MIALLTTWWPWAAVALAALLSAKRHERMCLAALRRWSAEYRRRDAWLAEWREMLATREHDLHAADRNDLYRAQRIRDAALAEARRWKAIAMRRRGIEWEPVPRGYRLTRGR